MDPKFLNPYDSQIEAQKLQLHKIRKYSLCTMCTRKKKSVPLNLGIGPLGPEKVGLKPKSRDPIFRVYTISLRSSKRFMSLFKRFRGSLNALKAIS